MARKRIDRLFEEAKKAASDERMDRADRYVELARKLGMRYNVSLISQYRRRICKKCYSYMHPGVSCRVRLRDGMLITKCNRCGTINRYVYQR